MASDLVMLSVRSATRDRVHLLKPPGVTYDEIVNRAIDALEEKIDESRSPSAKIGGTGKTTYPTETEVIN